MKLSCDGRCINYDARCSHVSSLVENGGYNDENFDLERIADQMVKIGKVVVISFGYNQI